MVHREKYIAPECEEIRIRVEEGILTVSGQENERQLGGYWDDDE